LKELEEKLNPSRKTATLKKRGWNKGKGMGMG